MIAISRSMYVDKLLELVDEYNNTILRLIKMKPAMSNLIHLSILITIITPKNKFNVGDYLKISKYKIISAKGYQTNWTEEVLVIKIVKDTSPWTEVIEDLNGEEITGTFYAQELQKQKQINHSLKLKT